MKRVGITGGIGTGKTTVCKIFEKLGVPIFNTDISARQAEDIDGVKEAMAELVGAEMLDDEGQINRPFLRSRAFTNPELLNKLSTLIGKYVMADLATFCETNKNEPYVLIESAILYESGMQNKVDVVIAVTADEEVRLARAMARDNATREEILNKINNQFTDKYKCDLADFIIYNNGEDLLGSYDGLLNAVTEIHNNLIRNETDN